MIVYYFGADSPWYNQSEIDINRRNMAVLLAIAEQPNIKLVYNVIRCTRALLFNKKDQIVSLHPKIKNVYIAIILPERGVLKKITQPLNRVLLKTFLPKEKKGQNNLSWCYWPRGYEDYKFLGLLDRMVFDTDHNIIEDPNLAQNHKKNRTQLLIEAGNRAEIILSSSRSMIAWYTSKGFNNTKMLMNGVFKSRVHFVDTVNKAGDDFQVTYCGTLSKWIKLEWLLKMAKDQPNWTINIIGKNFKTELADEFEIYKNIKMHGFLKPSEVDAILQKTNVCIGLYREEPALDVNSMKIYDYLAKGLPVVVNKYHAHLGEDFEHLIMVEDNYTDFVSAIKYAKPIEKDKLKPFLNNVTWQNRVKALTQSIDA
ncbi:glycosyltransferase [Winogradskyella schleiferi]|uniref:glycosyltransferase n=1 Tax=Winogradskyella schleiferi TaxID=2686078 RepID=UPI0015B8CF65|nr:glycosyltransferase [Winogradskyella schleiferi]